jgi:hypothetical protein
VGPVEARGAAGEDAGANLNNDALIHVELVGQDSL